MSSHNIVKKFRSRPKNARSCRCFEVAHQGDCYRGVYLSIEFFPPSHRNLRCGHSIVDPMNVSIWYTQRVEKPTSYLPFNCKVEPTQLSIWRSLRHRSTPDHYICDNLLANAQVCARVRRNLSAHQRLHVDEISCNTLNVTPCSPQERHEWATSLMREHTFH